MPLDTHETTVISDAVDAGAVVLIQDFVRHLRDDLMLARARHATVEVALTGRGRVCGDGEMPVHRVRFRIDLPRDGEGL